jgi:uncharacterized membrane protein
MRSRRSARAAAALTGAALVGVAVSRRTRSAGPLELQRSVTVERARDDVYRRWREPETQALVWRHLAEVTNATEHGAHWHVEAPLGRSLEWETRIVEEREGELIRWQSSGDVAGTGSVEFRDAPRDFGTEITLRVRVDPPGGAFGAAAARRFSEPPKLVLAKALRRFKSLVETGEIASTDHNPRARAG